MNGKEVIKRLQSEGFSVARIQGSHHILVKPGHPTCVPVPLHGTKDLGPGLIKAIERQSGVKLT